MQRVSRIVVSLSVVTLFMVSCVTPSAPPQAARKDANLMRYAHNVTACAVDSGYQVEVLNPWDSTVTLGNFFIPTEGFQSVICFSSTQWSVYLELGEVGRVKGLLEGRYVHDQRMLDLLADGTVKDVGTESAKNMELMIQLQPDIILYSPYFDGNQDPLKVTGAMLFPFADYLETTPLGRAEWIRIVGLLTGRREEADAWFDEIETRYLALKDRCAEVKERPTVFSDLPFNGQWYVAGGQSYMAQLFNDAGADYIWSDDNSTGSFPLDSETILAKARHADYWRVTNSSSLPMTYESLRRENNLYTLFDAYQNRHIIVCDIQPTGYFERSQLEPDVLLSDFIAIFHPEMMEDGYQYSYYYILF